MKRWHVVTILLVGLFMLAWAGTALAGPKVAIVQGEEKILRDSTTLPKAWMSFLSKDPERGRDLFSTLQFTPESITAVEKMVRKAVKLAGGWPVKRGDTVFIKTNANNDQWYLICVDHSSAAEFTATNTDGRVLRAVALLCKESGAKRIIIGEAAGTANSLAQMRVWGADMAVKDAGAELVDLDRVPYRWVKAPHALVYEEYAIPEVVLDADVVISVAPLKIHDLSGTTATLKNVGIGVPPNQVYGSCKTGLRHDLLSETIADVCEIVDIDYNVVGGIYGGEGQGPTRCDAVYHGIVIAGADPVAVDAVGSATMGLMPERFGYLRVAQQIGLGTYKNIKVVGNSVEEVMVDYKAPKTHAPGAWGKVWGW
jgi:uncharacterized protein (DUF362 family)